jgi:hypothetical protein
VATIDEYNKRRTKSPKKTAEKIERKSILDRDLSLINLSSFQKAKVPAAISKTHNKGTAIDQERKAKRKDSSKNELDASPNTTLAKKSSARFNLFSGSKKSEKRKPKETCKRRKIIANKTMLLALKPLTSYAFYQGTRYLDVLIIWINGSYKAF